MRRAAAILVFVLAGAAVNVAVAWACALWVRGGQSVNLIGAGSPLARMGVAPRAWGEAYEGTCFVGPGVTSGTARWHLAVRAEGADVIAWRRYELDGAQAASGSQRTSVYASAQFVDAGWPWRSLRWRRVRGPNHFSTMFGSAFIAIEPPPFPAFRPSEESWQERSLDLQRFAGRLGAVRTERDRLPVWPLWRGFALNTALYGTLAAGVVLVPRSMVRDRRRRRGLCELCGYEAGTAPVCPECGSARAVPGAIRSPGASTAEEGVPR